MKRAALLSVLLFAAHMPAQIVHTPVVPRKTPVRGLDAKMDVNLRQILAAYHKCGDNCAAAEAKHQGAALNQHGIEVRIVAAKQAKAETIRDLISQVGGQSGLGTPDVFFAAIPISKLEKFTVSRSVWRITLALPILHGAATPKFDWKEKP